MSHPPSSQLEGHISHDRSSHHLDPSTTKLACGILRQSFQDLLAKDFSRKETQLCREDATQWFFSDATYPGSLKWVCDVLRLEPEHLRHWLATYQQSGEIRQAEMRRALFRGLNPAAW
jgi:hypothetical protein